MTDYHGIIFSGGDGPGSEIFFNRGIGPYRLRTVMAQKGYRIKVIDFCESYSIEDLAILIRRYVGPGTKFLAISNTYMTHRLVQKLVNSKLIKLAKALAGSNLQIISGGARTLYYCWPVFDWCVSGYADESFPALVDFITGKTSQVRFTETDGVKLIDSNHSYPVKDTSDLTTIWLPEDLVKPHEAIPIEIARGCIFRCSFCAFPLNGKKKFDYIRSPENLVAEMRRNREMFGTKQYTFMDDTYNDSEFKMDLMHKAISSLDFKIRFSAYIKPELLNTWPHHTELLAESGLLGASLGLESFHYKSRQAIRKGPNIEGILRTLEKLHRDGQNGIGVQGNFIAGLPHDTVESLLFTHEWLKQNTQLVQFVLWQRLSIGPKTVGAYMSEIDKNPESFGYKILGQEEPGRLRWKSENLTSELSLSLSQYFNSDIGPHRLWGGFALSNYSQFSFMNPPELVRSRIRMKPMMHWERLIRARGNFVREYFHTQMSGTLNQPDFTPRLAGA